MTIPQGEGFATIRNLHFKGMEFLGLFHFHNGQLYLRRTNREQRPDDLMDSPGVRASRFLSSGNWAVEDFSKKGDPNERLETE